jgi:hypothetical protein
MTENLPWKIDDKFFPVWWPGEEVTPEPEYYGYLDFDRKTVATLAGFLICWGISTIFFTICVHNLFNVWTELHRVELEQMLNIKLVKTQADLKNVYNKFVTDCLNGVNSREFFSKIDMQRLSRKEIDTYIQMLPKICRENLPSPQPELLITQINSFSILVYILLIYISLFLLCRHVSRLNN